MRYGSAPRLKRDLVALSIVSVAYLAVSTFVTNSYYQLIMTLVPIWALFGVSWNILSGYGGQLSFGHASFFGIGAYVVTLALVYWNLTPWFGIPLGMVVAGGAAILIGLPTFRLRGHYFAFRCSPIRWRSCIFCSILGFQEMSLPMHREHPAAFLEFTNPRYYTLVAVVLLIAGLFVCMLVENYALRPGAAGDPAERAGGGGSGDQCPALEDAGAGRVWHDRRRGGWLLCLRAAGGDAGFGVRHAGFGAGGGGHVVRRRGLDLGAGDRRRHPGSAGGVVERGTGELPAGHPGRGVWCGDHRHHAGLARRAVLDDPRPLLPAQGPCPVAAAAGGRRAAG